MTLLQESKLKKLKQEYERNIKDDFSEDTIQKQMEANQTKQNSFNSKNPRFMQDDMINSYE